MVNGYIPFRYGCSCNRIHRRPCVRLVHDDPVPIPRSRLIFTLLTPMMTESHLSSPDSADESDIEPTWDSTEKRVNHRPDRKYYRSREGLDSLGQGIHGDATCYQPLEDGHFYFAITGTDLKHPGSVTAWPPGKCDSSKASMTEFMTGQFDQVNLVEYTYRNSSGALIEGILRSDRKPPDAQTASVCFGETTQGTPYTSDHPSLGVSTGKERGWDIRGRQRTYQFAIRFVSWSDALGGSWQSDVRALYRLQVR